MSMTRLETFCNLGYKRDPFLGVTYNTGDGLRVSRILNMAVESRAMVSIVGTRGIGKSEAVNSFLKQHTAKVIRVEKLDKENLTIADVRTAMILDLDQSNEGIRRGGEVSSRQLRRLLGAGALTDQGKFNKTAIVVVIEEAQRLHPNTLRSLKSLREIEWLGQKELFTIILVAQSNPMDRPGVSEVSLRSDCVRMQGLSADEASGYLRATLNKHFSDNAMEALAELPAARNYLELQALAVEMLNIALADGRDIVTLDDVQSAVAKQSISLPKGPVRAKTTQITAKGALAAVLERSQSVVEGRAVNATS